MLLFSFPQIKRFLHYYFVEETNFHRACNNLHHKKYKLDQDPIISQDQLENFNIILKGKIITKYKKAGFEYNIYNSKNGVSQLSNSYEKKEEEIIELILKNGDIFTNYLKVKGYKLSSVELLEDIDVMYLDSEIFKKIFERSFLKIEREKKIFIINTINTFDNMAPPRLNIFLEQIITNV